MTDADSTLMQLAREGNIEAFELNCMQLVEGGNLQLGELVAPFRHFEQVGLSQRVAAIGRMALDAGKAQDDARAALAIARVSLLADPQNDELRARTIDLYRRAHAEISGVEALLEASGLTTGRAARNAVRVMDLALGLKPGEPLISRTESVIVEVAEVDLEAGTVRIRRDGRPKTLPIAELAREFDRISADDCRVLRALHPERLKELVEQDPQRVVVGLIHAHGEQIDQDTLKDELVPQYVAPAAWAKWWTRVRGLLKKCPNIVMEGRSPLLLRYSETVRTREDEVWDVFAGQNDPLDWLATIEGYIRDQRRDKLEPSAELLDRARAHLKSYVALIQSRRAGEAFACMLLLARLASEPGDGADGRSAAAQVLRSANDPAQAIARLPDNTRLWEMALDLLAESRSEDAAARAVELIPLAGSGMLDRLVGIGREGGLLAAVQAHLDTALADPADYPEMVYWLWAGPKQAEGLNLPSDVALFEQILNTLNALGRTLNPGADATRRFRQRIRAALGLRDFGKARECIRNVDNDRAITLRTQLERLDGVGDVARDRMLAALRETHPQLWYSAPVRLEPWEEPNIIWATEHGLQRKSGERDHLVNVTMHENAKRIGEAAALGDLSENAEYKFALEERDLLRARLAQMNRELSIAQRLDANDVPTDHVGVGSRVRLRETSGGADLTLTFLGPFEADSEKGVYNYLAPMALKFMGTKPGERVRATLDSAGEQEFEVVEIANGLTAID